MQHFLTTITLALAASICIASPAKTQVMSDSDFRTMKLGIESEMQAEGKFDYVSASERDEAIAALKRMGKIISDVNAGRRFSEKLKVKLFNEQELVNEILLQKPERDRVTCAREITTGSHRKRTECLSLAEREARQDKSRNAATGLGIVERLPREGGQ